MFPIDKMSSELRDPTAPRRPPLATTGTMRKAKEQVGWPTIPWFVTVAIFFLSVGYHVVIFGSVFQQLNMGNPHINKSFLSPFGVFVMMAGATGFMFLLAIFFLAYYFVCTYAKYFVDIAKTAIIDYTILYLLSGVVDALLFAASYRLWDVSFNPPVFAGGVYAFGNATSEPQSAGYVKTEVVYGILFVGLLGVVIFHFHMLFHILRR